MGDIIDHSKIRYAVKVRCSLSRLERMLSAVERLQWREFVRGDNRARLGWCVEDARNSMAQASRERAIVSRQGPIVGIRNSNR